VTNVIELTNDALKSISNGDLPVSEQEMNLRFIKPSQTFYNQIMSLWFKYLYQLQERAEDQKLTIERVWNQQ